MSSIDRINSSSTNEIREIGPFTLRCEWKYLYDNDINSEQ